MNIKEMRKLFWSSAKQPGVLNKSNIQQTYEIGVINEREKERLMRRLTRLM